MSLQDPSKMHVTWVAALKAHDVDALVDLYEPQGAQQQPDGTIARGGKALREVYEKLVTQPLPPAAVQKQDIVEGDFALTSTVFPPDADGRVRVTAEVSRRQTDGSWRMVIDAPSFFVSNPPPSSAAPSPARASTDPTGAGA